MSRFFGVLFLMGALLVGIGAWDSFFGKRLPRLAQRDLYRHRLAAAPYAIKIGIVMGVIGAVGLIVTILM